MKKKMMKKVVSFALAMVMVLTSVLIGGVEVKADETAEEITLQGADFTDFGTYWSYGASDIVDGEAWPGTNNTGEGVVDVWRQSAADIYVYSKSGVALEAGTYRMSVSAQGGSASIKFAFSSSNKSEAVVINSDSYTTYSGTLTLDTASTLWIGFDIVCAAGGWAKVDSIKLEKVTTTSSNPTPPAEVTYTYEVTVVQGDKTVSGVSPAAGEATVGEDAVFTAKIKKVGSDNSVTEVTDLSGYHLYWYDKTADATTSDILTFTLNKENAGEYWFDVTLTDSSYNSLCEKAWFGVTVAATSGDTTPEGGSTTTPEGGNTTTPEGGNTTTPSDDKNTTEKEEEKVVVFDVPLQNADFEKEIGSPDDIWTGYLESGTDNWDKTGFDELNYAEEEPELEKPASHGAQCLKFNVESGEGLVVRQWVEKLPAGTYTITAPVMGADAKVSFVLGEYGESLMESGAVQLSGWNKWDTVKATFVIEEDMYNVQIGLKFVGNGSADGWGFVDNIKMQGGVPSTGDTTNAYAYVILMMAGLAIVGYSVKRNKVQF